MEDPPDSSNIKQATTILCEECKINPFKYKCPGCSLRTCSLPCVNSHKQRTTCSGRRSVADFVPISQFDDTVLISDFNMLEDVKRIADSAQRMRAKFCGYPNSRLPFPLKNLHKAATKRRTRILFLSQGMSKRESNRTYYSYRKKFISWTVEWRFHSTNVMIVDHGVDENSTFSSVIENHLKPGPWNHALKRFCDEPLDSLKFFIRKYPKGSRSPFRQLKIQTPIREQLANMVILEYPVIHVFLPSHSYDFNVIADDIPIKEEVKKPADNHQPSPEGVTFREEEIEDDGYFDPLVSDFINSANENQMFKEQGELFHIPPTLKGAELARSASESVENRVSFHGDNSSIDELYDAEDLVFHFNPGSVDMHSDPPGHTDLDDVFDFDEKLADQFLLDEELEEGEIA